MGIPSSEKAGKEFEKCPEGAHICRAVTICDLSTQSTPWGPKEQVYIGFEVTDFPVEWTDPDGNEKKGLGLIGVTWTNNLYEESNLGKNLISWRGKPFSKEEREQFDLSKLLGVPCMISVVHNEGKNGKTYANVASIMGIPKGTVVPDQVTPSVGYSPLDPELAENFAKLPEWLRKKCEAAIDPDPAPVNAPPPPGADDFDDDIPF